MADTMRYLRGDTKPISVPVVSGDVIEVGDLIVRDVSDSNTYKAATALDYWDTSEAVTQGNMKDEFVGVAQDKSDSGDTANIVVYTAGIFEYPAVSDSYLLGALVMLNKDTGLQLKLEFEDATDASDGFAKVARETGTATTVEVQIFSTIANQGTVTPTT